MGFIANLFKSIFKISIFVLVATVFVAFIPGLPPTHIKFESYETDPALKFEGKLAPNSLLNNVKVLNFDQEITGIESLALRGDEIFTGDTGGRILKIKNGKVSTVLKLQFPCDEVIRTECSWPLGLRFDPNGKLVFIDGYGGLLRADVEKGTVEKLLARHEVIDGFPLGAPNDLDITKDGTIYFSDESSASTLETINDIFYGHPSGRLLKYEPSKNKTTVVLDDIHVANGVQLSENEDFVLVSDLFRFRVLRYYLKGEKKGQSDVFVYGLPGLPDNIRSNKKGGFYVSLVLPRLTIELGPLPLVRRFLSRLEHLIRFVVSNLYRNFPTETTKSICSFAVSLFSIKFDESSNAFILELNKNGEIIRSLQSTNSALQGISQVTVGDKYTYFCSPFNSKIWYLSNTDL